MAKNETVYNVTIKGTTELQKLRKTIDETERSLKNLKKQKNQNKETTDRQVKGLDHLERKLKSTRKKYNDLNKEVKNTSKTTKSSVGFVAKMAGAFGAAQIASQAFTRVTRLLGQAIKDGITTFKDFEFAMAKVKAISGATDTEFVNLQSSAKELGKSTFFTASQVAQLQLNLSKLGFSSDEIMQSQESILLLSTALGEDLGRTATVVASTIRGFGADTVETARFADVMASAFSNSALDIEKFQTSMSKVSAIASMAGFSFEETTGLLGLLTDRGIEASIAGTSLRNILLHLQDGSSDLSKKLGRTVHSGEDFILALKELRNSGIDVAGVMEIVDRRQVQAMNSFIDGADTLTDFNELLSKSSGVSKGMAEIMEDTLAGSILKAKSAWEGLTIALLEGGGFMQKVVDGLTSSISGLTLVFQTAEQGASIEFGDRLKKASEQFAAHKKDYDDALKKGGGKTVMIQKELSDFLMKQEDLLAQNIEFAKFSIGMTEDGMLTATPESLGMSKDELDIQIKMIDSMEIALKQLFARTDKQVKDEKKNADEEKKRKEELKKTLAAELLAKKDLIKVQELLLAQAKELPQNNEKELTFKNKEIKLIKDEIKRLKELGVEKEKKDDPVKEELARLELELMETLNSQKMMFADKEIKTKEDLNNTLISSQLIFLQQMLEIENLSIEQRISLEQKVADIKAKNREDDLKQTEESEKIKSELIKANIDNALKIGASLGQIGEIMGKNSAAAKASIAITKAASVASAINGIIDAKGAITAQADSGDPYTAFGRMALMAAAVAPLIASLVALKSGQDKFANGGLTNGGMFKGASHANGGVKFAVGGRIHEAEGGEAIINKRSTAMFKPMLSAINQAGGGVKFANGGFLSTGEKFAMGGEVADVQQMIGGMGGTTQVVMVESDVTKTQGRVSNIESQATF